MTRARAAKKEADSSDYSHGVHTNYVVLSVGSEEETKKEQAPKPLPPEKENVSVTVTEHSTE